MSKNNVREIVNKYRRCVGPCNGAQLLIGLTQSTRASADWSLPGQAELDGRSSHQGHSHTTRRDAALPLKASLIGRIFLVKRFGLLYSQNIYS